MKSLNLQVQHYITQKIEADRGECQDAVAFFQSKGVFAIADGATEAYGARYWSRLVAKSWIRFLAKTDVESFLELASTLGERAHRRWGKKKLPWYAEEQLSRGSFTAFLGTEFHTSGNGIAWSALAVGDCCLVQTRKREIIVSVPLSEPAEFSYHPTLLPTTQSALARDPRSSQSLPRGGRDWGQVLANVRRARVLVPGFETIWIRIGRRVRRPARGWANGSARYLHR
jgi:hypothetical protein